MSIIVKEVEKIWADGGENAIRDRRLQIIEEAFKQIYSIEEITNLFVNWNRSNQNYFKDFEKRIADLEKPKVTFIPDTAMMAKRLENKKVEKSFLSEVLELWNKRNKK